MLLPGEIVSCAGRYWAVLGGTGSTWRYWAVLGGTGLYWALLGCTGLYWAVLGSNGRHWAELGCGGVGLMSLQMIDNAYMPEYM